MDGDKTKFEWNGSVENERVNKLPIYSCPISLTFNFVYYHMTYIRKSKLQAKDVYFRLSTSQVLVLELFIFGWATWIQFKILLLTFKAIHGFSPPYVSELITVKPKSTYDLRLSAATSYTENAAFTWCSPLCCCCHVLWNKLPADIRNVAFLNSFKKFNQDLSF